MSRGGVPASVDAEDLEMLRGSDLFDADWYRGENPDVALLGMDPAAHYLWLGHRLGRAPSPLFDPAAYLKLNDDVAAAGADPLTHFLRKGRAEGRWAVPLAGSAPPAPEGAPPSVPRPERPVLNWVTNPDNVGWAYGNNAKLLATEMPQFRHVVDGHEEGSDVALYFDIRVFQMRGRLAERNLLRVGGPRPVALAYGEDHARLAEDLKAFDAVIVLNRALMDLFSPLHPSVHLIPNALDLEDWAPQRRDRDPNAPFTVGFAGNLGTSKERKIKGFDIAEAAAKGLGVPLVHFGKGEGQIPREEMPERFFGAIDALVHPVGPGKEGCSNTIMEALAMGVPVITTRDAGFHSERIPDGEGILYAGRDEGEISAAIARLRDDAELRAHMARAGRRFAEAHHDVRLTAPLYARLALPPEAARPLSLGFVPFWEPPENFASSRLRCLQPAAILEGSASIAPRLASPRDPLAGGAPDALLVSQLASDATMEALEAHPDLPAVYDVCDRYFDDDRQVGGVHAKDRFHEMAARAEIVTASTVALKREMMLAGVEAPVAYLPDGIDYRGTRDPSPSDPNGPVLWYGNAGRGNFDSARWMIDHVMAAHAADPAAPAMRLIARTRHFRHIAATEDPAFAAYARICTDWTADGFVSDLRACRVCLLSHSPEERTKSPNRLITAIANGVPVIVSGAPSAAALLRAGGQGDAIVSDVAGLDAAIARLSDPQARARHLAAMQDVVEAEFGDAAIAARYETLVRCHLPPPGAAPARRPRVLFVSHNLNLGEGAPTSLLQTVTGLKARHDVDPVVFSVLPGKLREAYEAAGVEVILPAFGAEKRLATTMISRHKDRLRKLFAEILEATKPDLVVANTAASLWFARGAQEAGVPSMAIIRESSAEHLALDFGPPDVMTACREGLAGADEVVFVSDATRRLWARAHDLPRTTLIPNGVDLGALQGAAASEGKREARARLGHPEGELLLLSVGSVNARKAQGDIVEAFAALPPDLRARARLALVGAKPSEYVDQLTARIAEAGLEGRVRIMPETPEVAAWYRAADAFVFASTNESYPRVIVEAMGFGLPVLSSAIFGTREQIAHGRSGLLFPPGDVAEMTRLMARLVGDDAEREALAEGAAERVWELVTYPEMVHRYHTRIRHVLARAAEGAR